MEDQAILLADSRTVGFVDYGSPAATAVLWCHGGPGSRVEPTHLRSRARAAGLRIVGIDRPGYSLSAPQPARTIAGWVPDALAVAGHLGIEQFVTVGPRQVAHTRWRWPRSLVSAFWVSSPTAR